MIKIEAMDTMQQDDAELVAESLAGKKDAFRQIVERYQTLVCSLAYCATGSVNQSEDLAQETFVTAWKDLAALREPAKLRSWLCAIVRFRISNQLRRQGRDPIHIAEPLEVLDSSAALEATPSAQTITNEEIAILWRSLERIPELYREPLVLFYREHQSIETVAANLDLSEDAVKQRLSRGRKMLQEQVLAFVEGALEKTSPGKTFTLGVIAVLPAVATSAKAATVGAALAKGAPAAQGVMTVGSLGVLLAMLGSAYISLRAQADDSKSPRERQFLLQMFGTRMILILLSFMLFFIAVKLAFFRVPIHFDYLAAALFFYFCVDAIFLSACQSHRQQQIQTEDNTYVDAEWRISRRFTDSPAAYVRSKMNGSIKLARLGAFAIISGTMLGILVGAMGAMVSTQQTWEQQRQHSGNYVLAAACLATAGVALVQVLGFVRRRNLPRFLQVHRSRGFFVSPIIMGLCTLWFFNFRQYVAHTVGNTFNRESPTEILIFNLVVVLAYTVFIIEILSWKRKKSIRAGCAASPTHLV